MLKPTLAAVSGLFSAGRSGADPIRFTPGRIKTELLSGLTVALALVLHPVMLGFVNGLAIVIFMAQLSQFKVAGSDGALAWMSGLPLTVVTVLVDLAAAVVVGVIVSALVYAWNNARRIHAETEILPDGEKVYKVEGPLFFGSTEGFAELFDIKGDPDHCHRRFHEQPRG